MCGLYYCKQNATETLLLLKPEHLSRIEILRTNPVATKIISILPTKSFDINIRNTILLREIKLCELLYSEY